jgi:DNA sulfur modification protein DndD
MEIRELHLRNFRVYDGDHRLKFSEHADGRNIHLIGGFNGAGKTSLFSGVVLGLYGRDAAGLIFDRHLGDDLNGVYRRYLQESFSFSARTRGDNEMVVSLDMTHDGDEIRITRTWWFEDGALVDESLVVYVNREPLKIDVDAPEDRMRVLQEFIEGIAPSRVAKFFFFDGEDIKQIAEREPDQAVVEGLNQLLGFHALKRLSDDLTTLQGKLRRELPSAAQSGLLDVAAELDRARADLSTALRNQEKTQGHVAGISDELSSLESELKTMFGGRLVKDRNDALDLLAERQRELASISSEIQSFVSDVLVLSLPGKVLDRVVKRARKEKRVRSSIESRRLMKPLGPELRDRLFGSARLRGELTRKQRYAMQRAWEEAWESVLDASEEELDETFDLFSTEQLDALLRLHSQTRETGRRELVARIARRSHLEAEVQRLQSAVNELAVDSRAEKLLNRKSELLERRLETESVADAADKEIARLRQEISNAEAVMSRLEKQLDDAAVISGELDAAQRLKLAAEDFMSELRRRRTEALAERTTEMIRRLAHKEELVHSVQINPDDFGIRILDRSGEEILNPSAGEREVFALALIWGLAQVSNRRLFVMIDTPLGRLDQMHRANFVKSFLPVAGTQVIVLSTDSEIDGKWHQILEPNLAQQALIDFSDERQSSSFVSDSYFEVAPPPSEVTT